MAPTIIKLNKFRFRKKIASFDYDWTIVKPKSNGTFPKDAKDWKWLRTNVPDIIREFYDKGYCIMIFTNQSKDWKVEQITQSLTKLNIPILISIATEKEDYKPKPTLFNHAIQNKEWNKNKSFFVGDALGRPNDWSDSDKVFAENIKMKIKSPEDIFPFQETQIHTDINIATNKHQEIIIMTGYPGSGKSTIADLTFKPQGYIIISGDKYKTSKEMIKASIPHIANKKSVVFDATNATKEKRKEYITLANHHNLPIRCIHVTTSMEESLARNNIREKPVPKIVYYKYRKVFEKPTSDEGCDVVEI